jgi:hypothetical protein
VGTVVVSLVAAFGIATEVQGDDLLCETCVERQLNVKKHNFVRQVTGTHSLSQIARWSAVLALASSIGARATYWKMTRGGRAGEDGLRGGGGRGERGQVTPTRFPPAFSVCGSQNPDLIGQGLPLLIQPLFGMPSLHLLGYAAQGVVGPLPIALHTARARAPAGAQWRRDAASQQTRVA